jgi:hypothetical protein
LALAVVAPFARGEGFVEFTHIPSVKESEVSVNHDVHDVHLADDIHLLDDVHVRNNDRDDRDDDNQQQHDH